MIRHLQRLVFLPVRNAAFGFSVICEPRNGYHIHYFHFELHSLGLSMYLGRVDTIYTRGQAPSMYEAHHTQSGQPPSSSVASASLTRGGASGCVGASTYAGGRLLGRGVTPDKSDARHGGFGGRYLDERAEDWGRRATTTSSIVGPLTND